MGQYILEVSFVQWKKRQQGRKNGRRELKDGGGRGDVVARLTNLERASDLLKATLSVHIVKDALILALESTKTSFFGQKNKQPLKIYFSLVVCFINLFDKGCSYTLYD